MESILFEASALGAAAPCGPACVTQHGVSVRVYTCPGMCCTYLWASLCFSWRRSA